MCSKCPGRERSQPALVELPVSLRQPLNLRPPSASPLLADDNPSSSIKHLSSLGSRLPVRHTCSTLSALAASPSARLHFQISELWCVSRKPLATKNYRPASSALSLRILAWAGCGRPHCLAASAYRRVVLAGWGLPTLHCCPSRGACTACRAKAARWWLNC